KILDMGLARLGLPDEQKAADQLTHDHVVLGTPDYMAPEQGQDSHTVDIRADIYSLGCTLYQLLTGRVPFPGGTLLQKLDKHRGQEPEPVERQRSEVGPELAAVLRRMMAKRPEDRFQTPAEVAAALQPFSQHDGEAPPVRRTAPAMGGAAIAGTSLTVS